MLFLEEQTLNWKSMEWKAFQKKIWRNGGGYLNKKLRVRCSVAGCLLFPLVCSLLSCGSHWGWDLMHSLAAICQPCGRLGGISSFLFLPEHFKQLPNKYGHSYLFVRVRGRKAEVKLSWWFPNALVSLLFKHTFGWTALVYAGQHDIDTGADPSVRSGSWQCESHSFPLFVAIGGHTQHSFFVFLWFFWSLTGFEFCY